MISGLLGKSKAGVSQIQHLQIKLRISASKAHILTGILPPRPLAGTLEFNEIWPALQIEFLNLFASIPLPFQTVPEHLLVLAFGGKPPVRAHVSAFPCCIRSASVLLPLS